MKKYILFVLLCICISPILCAAERSYEWSKVRNEFLKTHNICAVCGTSKDLQVHHIKPFHLRPELELDPDNLITLCTSKYWGFNCHLIIGHGGNFKYENPWILDDIDVLSIISDPWYIKEKNTDDRDEYIGFIRKRVKSYNKAIDESSKNQVLTTNYFHLYHNGKILDRPLELPECTE
jgi:5-methylcytosine-specific restriction enzyme A